MISFHFPPIASSSGFLRSLKFAQYFDKSAFNVSLITATQGAYEKTDEKNLRLLDNADFAIHRALALDASRHLSIKGKYFGFMTWPDKWSSWVPFGLIKGLYVAWSQRSDVIWVTFPISSALLIGMVIAKLTKKPLIVDLRDPIWEEETWQNNRRQRILKRLEKRVLIQAEYIIFTSPGTIEKYRHRYPQLIEKKAELILNGYDEADFSGLIAKCQNNGKRVFLHSGLIPVYERDPSAFFMAIAELKKEGIVNAKNHEFRLRACGNEAQYIAMTAELGIDELVTFPGPLPYNEALAEMLGADALMIFQASTCNWQIPAKLFEYFRAEKPILAWTDEQGDTAQLIRKVTTAWTIAPLTDSHRIAHSLTDFIRQDKWIAQTDDIHSYSRENLTRQLAKLIKSAAKHN